MRIFVPAQIHTAVKLCFAHHHSASDFDEAFRAYLCDIVSVTSRMDFDLATMRLMASLHNGHTAFDDEWLWQTHGGPLGFYVRELVDGWTVVKSVHPSVPAGAEIIAVGDVPIGEFAESKLPFLAASGTRAARTNLFRRPYLFPSSFSLRLSDGEYVQVRRGEHALPGRALAPALDRLSSRIPVLRIPSFEMDSFEVEAVGFVDQLKEEKVLILDLRGNGGGNTPLRLLARLMDRPYRTWAATTPRHTALNIANGAAEEHVAIPSETQEAATSHFTGGLIMLTDRETASAAEDFLMPFKDNGRAIIVGEPTAGSSGQPLYKDLGDGMRLWVGAKRQTFPDGEQFEGIGITPDIVFEMTRHDVTSESDSLLALAMTLAC